MSVQLLQIILLVECQLKYFSVFIVMCLFPPGWPRMKWVVTDTKYLTKPSKDWQPHIPTANTDTAYIEVGSTALIEMISLCIM